MGVTRQKDGPLNACEIGLVFSRTICHVLSHQPLLLSQNMKSRSFIKVFFFRLAFRSQSGFDAHELGVLANPGYQNS